MSEGYMKISQDQQLVAQHELTTRDGQRVAVELIRNSDTSMILAHSFLDDAGVVVNSTSCGYCEGVHVGCVNCPNNDPYLDCISKTISCQS